MSPLNFFISKPILSIFLCIFIFVGGLISLLHLPIRLFPKVELSVIQIETNYSGASAKIMQSFVTNILQESLSGLDNVDYISSASQFGKSDIKIYFKLGIDADKALAGVVNKLSSVREKLPKEINDPIIRKISSDDNPVMIIAFTSRKLSKLAISDYLQRAVKSKLELIDGVSAADVMGDHYAMRIWLDVDKLAEYDLTPSDVSEDINKQNISSAVGEIKENDTNFNLTAKTQAGTVDQFNQITLKKMADRILKLSDVAKVELGPESDKVTAFFNGSPAVMIFVKLLPGANPMLVSRRVTQSMNELQKTLPEDIQTKIIFDSSQYIHMSIKELISTMMFTLLIIFIVMFIFLGGGCAALVPLLTIPLSLAGTCVVLWMVGCSINTLTLLAMVLAIGLVVDDAIVVLDNIKRHREKGLTRYQAVLVGTQSVAAAIVSMSIILAMVYLPIGFLGGLTGKLFFEFSLTLAVSVIISALIAFILIPLLGMHFLSAKNNLFTTINEIYRICLNYAFFHKKIITYFWLVCLFGCFVIYYVLPKELAPREDQGFLQVIGNAPTASSEAYLSRYTEKLNSIYNTVPEVGRYVYLNNIPEEHQFLSFITLQPWDKRKKTAAQLHWQLQDQMNTLSAVNPIVIEPPVLPADGGLPIEFVLKSTLNYRQLYSIAKELQQRAMQSGIFSFLQLNMKFDQPGLNLNIDHLLVAHLDINMQEIVNTTAWLYGENSLQKFDFQGQVYPVILHINHDQEKLTEIKLRNSDGQLISFSNFSRLEKIIEPNVLNQFDKLNSITLSGMVNLGNNINNGLDFLKSQLNLLNPESVWIDYAGESRELMQENNNFILFFAVIFVVFMVLSVQFENLLSPLIILFGSVPFALFPALLTLLFFHVTINIYTKIGLVTLIGLISKHGILLVQFANHLRQKSIITAKEAVCSAATIRLRPILMTTIAMVLSAMPLIFSSGPGRQARFDLGVVIVSGVLLGTLFTLVCIPILYESAGRVADVIFKRSKLLCSRNLSRS